VNCARVVQLHHEDNSLVGVGSEPKRRAGTGDVTIGHT
jgi:hypothetical protein